jgi:hypothetical protein
LKRVLLETPRFILSFPVTPKRLLNGLAKWMGEIYWADVDTRDGNRFGNLSVTSKEILRVLTKLNTYANDYWCRYIVAIWDTDQAYRNRGQDLLPEVRLNDLIKNPRKEILRVIDILIQREKGITGVSNQVPKALLLKKLAWWLLLVPRFKRMVVAFFKELNVEEIKITIEDRYWMSNKFDYNYEGKTFKERMEWRKKEDEDWIKPELPAEKPRIEINPPNLEFYQLNETEAKNMCQGMANALMENWRQFAKPK